LFLREHLMPSRIGVVIFGFPRVLVILRPGLKSFQTAALLPLAAALAFAVALTQTKGADRNRDIVLDPRSCCG
jgi:drug/metabolite transporter (DMT)-like permease